jgi:hypothetical protein
MIVCTHCTHNKDLRSGSVYSRQQEKEAGSGAPSPIGNPMGDDSLSSFLLDVLRNLYLCTLVRVSSYVGLAIARHAATTTRGAVAAGAGTRAGSGRMAELYVAAADSRACKRLPRGSYVGLDIARHGLTEVILRRQPRILACFQRALPQLAPQILLPLACPFPLAPFQVEHPDESVAQQLQMPSLHM